jgi:hypothetical protein
MSPITTQKIANPSSYAHPKNPYNTHKSLCHFMMGEAAEFYFVLSIILIR